MLMGTDRILKAATIVSRYSGLLYMNTPTWLPGPTPREARPCARRVGVLVELRKVQPGVTPHDGLSVRDPGRHALKEIGQIEVHVSPLVCTPRPYRIVLLGAEVVVDDLVHVDDVVLLARVEAQAGAAA